MRRDTFVLLLVVVVAFGYVASAQSVDETTDRIQINGTVSFNTTESPIVYVQDNISAYNESFFPNQQTIHIGGTADYVNEGWTNSTVILHEDTAAWLNQTVSAAPSSSGQVTIVQPNEQNISINGTATLNVSSLSYSDTGLDLTYKAAGPRQVELVEQPDEYLNVINYETDEVIANTSSSTFVLPESDNETSVALQEMSSGGDSGEVTQTTTDAPEQNLPTFTVNRTESTIIAEPNSTQKVYIEITNNLNDAQTFSLSTNKEWATVDSLITVAANNNRVVAVNLSTENVTDPGVVTVTINGKNESVDVGLDISYGGGGGGGLPLIPIGLGLLVLAAGGIYFYNRRQQNQSNITWVEQ